MKDQLRRQTEQMREQAAMMKQMRLQMKQMQSPSDNHLNMVEGWSNAYDDDDDDEVVDGLKDNSNETSALNELISFGDEITVTIKRLKTNQY